MPEKLIAIKGFKMPETCFSCPMLVGGWCGVSPAEVDERVAETVEEAWIQKKPEWCPLVEVEEKHAHWIGTEIEGYTGSQPVYSTVACSHCGFENDQEPEYCEQCGYRMDEVIS